MEHLVEAVQHIACISSSQARLALLLVADAMRGLLTEQEALELAEALPLEIALLIGQVPDDVADIDLSHTREEVSDLLDARTIAAVCSVLAMEGPATLRGRLVGELRVRVGRLLSATGVDSGTWTKADSTRPTIRVESAAMTRPTVRLRSAG